MFNLQFGFGVCALIYFNGLPLILSLSTDEQIQEAGFHKDVSNELGWNDREEKGK